MASGRKRSTARSTTSLLGTTPDGALKHYLEVARNLADGKPALGRDLPVERIQAGELLKVREDIAKSRPSIKTLANEIGRARVVFNFAWKEGLIDRPIRFGESFKKPGKAAFRKDRAKRELERGKMMFSAEDVRLALEHADVHMRAMILLGMGHVDDSMAANYRHDIDDARLRAVVDHVHVWLFGTGEQDDDQTADQEKDQVADREDDE